MPNELRYTAVASAREGAPAVIDTPDQRLDLDLATPEALGGEGGAGTNAEQLLAAGYAACLLSALRLAALKKGASIDGGHVRCTLELVGDGERFEADVRLEADLPSLPQDLARDLLEAATQAWPYAQDRVGRPPAVGLTAQPEGGGADLQAREEAARGAGYA